MNADQRELQEACKANDIARVRELFATRPLTGLDADLYGGLTSPDLPLMRCLLEHGADIERYLRVRSPTSLDMVKLFVEFGYDVKAEGHKMLQDFAHDREALDWLIDHGADANRVDEYREVAYPFGRRSARDYSLKVLNFIAALGDTGLFDHIVSRGANPQNSVALHWASKCRDPDKTIAMIDHLLDKQHMNIEANNADFWTVVDAPDVGTPLECAVYYRNLAAVKHFLKRGAQPRGAADISAGRWDVPPFLPALGPLLDGGADPDDALEWVICTNDIEAAKLCVEAGADPRAITSSQRAYAIRRRPVTHPSDMDAFLQSFDHAS